MKPRITILIFLLTLLNFCCGCIYHSKYVSKDNIQRMNSWEVEDICVEPLYEGYKIRIISNTGIPWRDKEIRASIKLSNGKVISTGFSQTNSNGEAVFKVKKTDIDNTTELTLVPKDKYFTLMPVKSANNDMPTYVALPAKRNIQIIGKIVSSKNNAIPDVEVKVFVEDTFVKGIKTDSAGKYSIPVSDYKAGQKLTVKASHPDHLSSSITMFNFDSSLPVTFTLNPKRKQHGLGK